MPLPLHSCRFESQLFRVQGPGDLVEVELEYGIEYAG